MKRYDLLGFLGTLLVHGLVGFLLIRAPARIRDLNRVVEMEVKRTLPPPVPVITEPPKPVPPPPQPKPIRTPKLPPSPPQAPIPNQTPKTEPPKTAEPPKPVFGVSAASTAAGESTFSVPVGNTTVADPKTARPGSDVPALPSVPAGAVPGPQARPAAALAIKEYPTFDEESCQPPRQLYPEDLLQSGVEGDTVLRVEISGAGKVVSARALRGPNKRLDELAIEWMKTHCRVRKAARDTADQPVSVVVKYTFEWRIDQ